MITTSPACHLYACHIKTALERQDSFRKYLAHHELKRCPIIIVVVVVLITIIIVIIVITLLPTVGLT